MIFAARAQTPCLALSLRVLVPASAYPTLPGWLAVTV